MIYCRACGHQMHETAANCPHCGAVQFVTAAVQKKSGSLWLPVSTFILGLILVAMLFDDSGWDKDTATGEVFFSVITIGLGVLGAAIQERGRVVSIMNIILGVIGVVGGLMQLAP